jgi:hypothetical protein
MMHCSQMILSGSISANGQGGGNAAHIPAYEEGGGGGGSGGSIKLVGAQISISTGITALGGGPGQGSQNGDGFQEWGGYGGEGRIRIEYGTFSGTTNPSASLQQVNYYNLTGTNPTTLYMPDVVSSGSYARYSLQYVDMNTTGGDQLFNVILPNRQYSSVPKR